MKVIPTTDGKIIRTASGRLDIYRHLVEVRYQLRCVSKQAVLSESEEIHHMRYFFQHELASFLMETQLQLVDLHAFGDLAHPPSEGTWEVLVVGKAV